LRIVFDHGPGCALPDQGRGYLGGGGRSSPGPAGKGHTGLREGAQVHGPEDGGSRGEELASKLTGMGLEYFGAGRRAFYEVYPHAVLRSLPPPLPQYKKGPQAVREEEAERALTLLSGWEPTLHWTPTMGKVLSRGKGAADRLDALLAAVSLYRHSLYSGGLSLVLGDDDDGFLLLPRGWEDGRRM